MSTSIRKQYADKFDFVNKVNNALNHVLNVDSVEYVIFAGRGTIKEYAKVNYKGGNFGVRNCTCNSLFGIFAEISKLLNGGYYDEVDYYNELLQDPAMIMYSSQD